MSTEPLPSGRGTMLAVLALLRPNLPLLGMSMLAGAVSGIAMTMLLAAITSALDVAHGDLGAVVLAYCAATLLSLVTGFVSELGTNAVGQRLVADLRVDLSARILRAPVDELERYRLHRLQTILNGDIDTVSVFGFNIAPLITSLAVTVGCLSYLAWLSPVAFLAAVACIGLGALVQRHLRTRAVAAFDRARTAEDALQKSFNTIALGAKELRLDRRRRLAVFRDEIGAAARSIRDTQVRAVRLYAVGRAAGSLLFFGLIALLLSWRDIGFGSAAGLGGFVLVLLYVKGPVDQLIGMLPMFSRAQVAFSRIIDLSRRFQSAEPDLLSADGLVPAGLRSTIELRGVSYRFPEEDRAGFRLGPIDLVIRKGKITFIVGDNGAGKTTLIRLLLGLYEPVEGQVVHDGVPLTGENRDDYRQLFAAVLSDFHLFEEAIVGPGASEQEELEAGLRQMGLAGKTAIVDGRITTTDLSTGQRKRLAFVQARASGRPVLVFDEWAADQDPAFRRLYYTRLLPELRDAGRTVIVVSHDDRYFGVADQVIRLSDGRVAKADGPGAAAGGKAFPAQCGAGT